MNRKTARTRQVRTRQMALHLERLEDRYLMNADPAAVEAFDGNNEAMVTTPPAASQAEGSSNYGLPDWFIQAIEERYSQLFGTSRTVTEVLVSLNATIGRADFLSYDSTNVQVVGVDEADLVETDGKYLYFISGNDLYIVDAQNPTDLSLTSRFRLADAPTGMYLSEGRLTLVSSRYKSDATVGGNRGISRIVTEVNVLDVAEPGKPRVVQSSEFSGRLTSSRMVDGNLRLVTQQERFNSMDFILPLESHVTGERDEQGRQVAIFETRDEYLKRVLRSYLDAITPYAITYAPDGEMISRVSFLTPSDVSGLLSEQVIFATTVISIDTHGNSGRPLDAKVLLTGRAADIYATEDSIYLFGTPVGASSQANTTIWKLDFSDKGRSVQLAAMGSVQGTLLNQFSVDESDGFLRVVTSDPTGQSGINVTTFKKVGPKLVAVGKIEGLAAGEQLRSVRFLGDRLFAVTFKQVDPLFAIDLSNPFDPRVVGTLRLPGFSDYLQPIDENHLIAVGRAVDEVTGALGDIEVSLFDITVLHNPRLAHRYTIAGTSGANSLVTSGGWSAGVGDHHAFSYFAEESLMTLSVNGSSGTNGLQVFHVDLDAGFTLLTVVEHGMPVLRSLKIGDGLFVVSSNSISAHNPDDPSQEWDRLDLRAPAIITYPPTEEHVLVFPSVEVPHLPNEFVPSEEVPQEPEYFDPTFLPVPVRPINIGEGYISLIGTFPYRPEVVTEVWLGMPPTTIWLGESVLLPSAEIDVGFENVDWEVAVGNLTQKFESSSTQLPFIPIMDRSPMQVNEAPELESDRLFEPQFYDRSNAPQSVASRDRAFDSLFVPVSRSTRVVVEEDVQDDLAEVFEWLLEA